MWTLGSKALHAHRWWLLLQGPSPLRTMLTTEALPSIARRAASRAAAEPAAEPVESITESAGSHRWRFWLAVPIAIGAAVLGLAHLAGKHRWQSVLGISVYDINQDGVLDPIGAVRSQSGDEDSIKLAGFDGKDGDRLWETEPSVGSYQQLMGPSSR